MRECKRKGFAPVHIRAKFQACRAALREATPEKQSKEKQSKEKQSNYSKRGRPPIERTPGRDISQAQRAGYSKLDRLFKGIQDLTKKSNNKVLYPSIVNHMIIKEEREKALSQIGTFRQFKFSKLSDSCNLLYRLLESSTNEFRKEIEREEVTPLFPDELSLLPDAAEQANFSRNFNMTEDFALFRYKLMPIRLTCTTSHSHLGRSCTFSASCIDGSPVPEGFGVAEKVASVVHRLEEISKQRGKENMPYKEGNWNKFSLPTPARLLGAITWECWQVADLQYAIRELFLDKVDFENRIGALKLERPSSFASSSTSSSASQKIKWTRSNPFSTLRSWMSMSARENEIRYYYFLLDLLQHLQQGEAESTISALLVPSVEGICYACSQEALGFLRDSLRDELLKPLPRETKEMRDAQSTFYDGTTIATLTGIRVDLSSLTGTNQSLTTGAALKEFKNAINSQRTRFDTPWQQIAGTYWNDLLSSAPDFGVFQALIKKIDQVGANTFPERDQDTFPLSKQLERMGLPSSSIHITSQISLEIKGATSITLEKGASHLLAMARRVETYWVDEYGKVGPLGSKGPQGDKERAPDGMWKRNYEKYINQVSAKLVRMGIEQFALSLRKGDTPIQDDNG